MPIYLDYEQVMRRKVVYILSGIEKSISFEWIVDRLDKGRFDLYFIILGKGGTPLTEFLQARKVPFFVVPFFSSWQIFALVFRVLFLLTRIRPDIVHAHLFDGGRIGITAAYLARVRVRIYTRHHSTYHHDHFPLGVMFDRLINSLSTHIVSISPVVTNVLVGREMVARNKITLIPHGFDFNYFFFSSEESMALIDQYRIPPGVTRIGVISRYVEYKGIPYIIDAFSRLVKSRPDLHLILANATGPLKTGIQASLHSMLPPGTWTEILFEKNLRALYGLFDIYVHIPVDPDSEAFGQTYIEALAMKKPSVFTLSGIANEVIEDRVNAMVVPYRDSNSVFLRIEELLRNRELRERLGRNGYNTVRNRFSIEGMIKRLETLYS